MVEILVLASPAQVSSTPIARALDATASLPGRIKRTQRFLQALIGAEDGEDDETGPQSR